MALVNIWNGAPRPYSTHGQHFVITSAGDIYTFNHTTDCNYLNVWKNGNTSPIATCSSTTVFGASGQLAGFSPPSGNSGTPDVAIDSTGKIHILEHIYTLSGTVDVAYGVFNTATDSFEAGTWTVISSALMGYQYSDTYSVCVDSNDDVHVIYTGSYTSMGSTYSAVCYKKRTSGSWSAETRISAATASSFNAGSIGIGPSNYLYCYWQPSATQIIYRQFTTAWQTESVESGLSAHQIMIGNRIPYYPTESVSILPVTSSSVTNALVALKKNNAAHADTTVYGIYGLGLGPHVAYIDGKLWLFVTNNSDYKAHLYYLNGSTWTEHSSYGPGLSGNKYTAGSMYYQYCGITSGTKIYLIINSGVSDGSKRYYEIVNTGSGTDIKSSKSAYMEGGYAKTTTHAYIEGYLSNSSSVPAHLAGKPAFQPAYLSGISHIYFDVVPFTAKTSTGTQNITGDINGSVPKLALFMMNEGTQDNQTPTDAGSTFGITDGTFGMCQDQSLEDGLGYSTPGATGGLFAGTGASKRVINGARMGAANHSAFITNGVTLNWVTGANAAYKGAVLLIGSPANDSLILTKGGTINISNPLPGNEFVTSGIGFEPDAIIFYMDQGTDWGYGGLGFGIAWKDERGNWLQKTISLTWANGYFNYADSYYGDTVAGSAASGSAWAGHDAEVSEVTNDSFTLKVLHGDGIRDFYIGYMAIKLTPGFKIAGMDQYWPPNTGTQTIPAASMDPKAVFMCSYEPYFWPYNLMWTSAMFKPNVNVSGGEYIDGTDSVTGCHSFVNGSAIVNFTKNGQAMQVTCTGMSPGLITLNQTMMTYNMTFTGVMFGNGTFTQSSHSAYMYGSSKHQSAYLNGYMFDGKGNKPAFSQETRQQREIAWSKITPSSIGDSDSVGGFVVALSYTGQYMLVSTKAGGTYVSSNYGISWTQTSTLAALDACVSDDGSVMVFSPGGNGDGTSGICISTNYGANWTRYYPTHSQSRVCVSGDGNVIYLRSYNQDVLKTTNHGAGWSIVTPTNNYSMWIGTTLHTLRCDYDGSNVVMGALDVVHVSTDYGASWTYTTPSAGDEIESVDISNDGTIMVCCLGYNTRKISTNSGVSWTSMATPPKYTLNNSTAWSANALDYGNIECDATGSKITLTLFGTYPCISYDKSNWELTYPDLSTTIEHNVCFAVSGNGNYFMVLGQGGYTDPQYVNPLFIGKTISESVLHAFLAGPNPSLPAYTRGLDTTKDSHASYTYGGIGVKSSVTAYMTGSASAADAFSNQTSYTKGSDSTSGVASAYMAGGNEVKIPISVCLAGAQMISGHVWSYTRGATTDKSSTGGYLNGTYFIKGQQAGFVEGLTAGAVLSHKSAYLHGDYSTTFPFTDDYTDTTGDPWNEAKWVVDKSG